MFELSTVNFIGQSTITFGLLANEGIFTYL